jgi:hypothetical protein
VQAHEDVVRRAVALAAAAMQWPDAHTQLRATAVCRTAASVAGAPLNLVSATPADCSPAAAALKPMLVPCILKEAVVALSAVSEGHAASEMLLLVRSIYIACAQWQPSSMEQLRSMLPNTPQEVFAQVRSVT